MKAHGPANASRTWVFVFVSVMATAATARAGDTSWKLSPPATGDWYEPTNWDAGVPGDWDDAYVDNGGTAVISSGTCRSQLYAGYDNAGTIRQTAGRVIPSWHIQLGQNLGSEGRYFFEGGIISNPNGNIYVGWYGQAYFTQKGGSIESLNMLSIARGDGSTGSYTLSNGSIESRLVKIGQHGEGEFLHTGGNFNSLDRFYLATESQAKGTYSLSGTGVLTTVTEFVGSEGLGKFYQNGGTHQVSDELTLGRDTGSRGEYAISGGSLDAKEMIVGSRGAAVFEVTGPDATITVGAYSQAGGGELVSQVTGIGLSTVQVDLVATLAGKWTVRDDGAGYGRFDVLVAGQEISGSFDSVEMPDGTWTWGIADDKILWVEHVPEPATLSLLALGACLLLFRRKRR